jgi:hypothetical protein
MNAAYQFDVSYGGTSSSEHFLQANLANSLQQFNPAIGPVFHNSAPLEYDEIRTIYITGFPADVKDRELNNILRFMPGYEASQMNWKTGQPQGFALFQTAAHGRAAVEVLVQLQFEENTRLRCEMARKNMFLKEDLGKRGLVRSPLMASPQSFSGMGAPSFAPVGNPHVYIRQPSLLLAAGIRPQMPQIGFAPVTNTRDNPPCNTLFIGNLGDNVDEQELRDLFSSQPGYKQLKLVRGQKLVNCFVEYVDVTTAVMVHNLLQGAVLPTSDRGGIRIQFSRNPYGKRGSEDGSPSPALLAAVSDSVSPLRMCDCQTAPLARGSVI